MAAGDLMVAGRRFRTREDYEAALRDQKKIEAIKARMDLEDPRQLYKLFSALQSGAYRFETAVGTDFDDAIFEEIEKMKQRGITSANAGNLSESRQERKPERNKGLTKSRPKQPKASKAQAGVRQTPRAPETASKETVNPDGGKELAE